MSRRAEARRQTKETEVRVRIDLDGTGQSQVKTGIGFFDHMLEALARHAPRLNERLRKHAIGPEHVRIERAKEDDE